MNKVLIIIKPNLKPRALFVVGICFFGMCANITFANYRQLTLAERNSLQSELARIIGKRNILSNEFRRRTSNSDKFGPPDTNARLWRGPSQGYRSVSDVFKITGETDSELLRTQIQTVERSALSSGDDDLRVESGRIIAQLLIDKKGGELLVSAELNEKRALLKHAIDMRDNWLNERHTLLTWIDGEQYRIQKRFAEIDKKRANLGWDDQWVLDAELSETSFEMKYVMKQLPPEGRWGPDFGAFQLKEEIVFLESLFEKTGRNVAELASLPTETYLLPNEISEQELKIETAQIKSTGKQRPKPPSLFRDLLSFIARCSGIK